MDQLLDKQLTTSLDDENLNTLLTKLLIAREEINKMIELVEGISVKKPIIRATPYGIEGDVKGALQSIAQKRHMTLPIYITEKVDGGFKCIVGIAGATAVGISRSKKQAEKQAAYRLYSALV